MLKIIAQSAKEKGLVLSVFISIFRSYLKCATGYCMKEEVVIMTFQIVKDYLYIHWLRRNIIIIYRYFAYQSKLTVFWARSHKPPVTKTRNRRWNWCQKDCDCFSPNQISTVGGSLHRRLWLVCKQQLTKLYNRNNRISKSIHYKQRILSEEHPLQCLSPINTVNLIILISPFVV